MQFVSKFEVPAPLAEAWPLLGDVPRIAPCLPGASVRQLSDELYEGEVSIKVGPIRAGYSGQATVVRRDDTEHVMVLDAQGKEGNGKGSAAATITLQLSESGPFTTLAEVTTDLTITGRLAQFGRSAMSDVSQRLIDQFAVNLAAMVAPDTPSAGSAASTPGAQRTAPVTAAPAQELNALTLALPLVKRALPAVGGLALGLVLGAAWGGRSRGGVQPWSTASPRLDQPWPGCRH